MAARETYKFVVQVSGRDGDEAKARAPFWSAKVIGRFPGRVRVEHEAGKGLATKEAALQAGVAKVQALLKSPPKESTPGTGRAAGAGKGKARGKATSKGRTARAGRAKKARAQAAQA